MAERRTVTVRDLAGNISEVDVPDESEVYPFKFWTEHLESGRYVIVDGAPVEDAGESDDDAYPEGGTIAQVLDWVGEDADRALEALEVENAKDEPRKGLVEALSKGDA